MVVLGNMPSRKRVRTRHGQVIDHFGITPRMSTYLLGFVLGPYVRQERSTEHGVNVAVWTRREDRSKGDYALAYSSKMLRIIEKYFSLTYQLPKLDLVASPDYPVGAMENWGLLVFHQRALLYVAEYRMVGGGGGNRETYQPHLLPKFRTSKIIVHELLHQWFGNLATMNWWSEIWLNEGFATFFIYHFLKDEFPALSEFHQTWKLVDALQLQTGYYYFDISASSTFGHDYSRSSNYIQHYNMHSERYALVRNFSSDEQIFEAFDEHHLYAKGGAIVGMISQLIGEKSTRNGVRRYLSANAYRSVDRWELWKHLDLYSSTTYSTPNTVTQNRTSSNNESLGRLMESWLTNPGFPEVKIARDNNISPTSFRLEQKMADYRFHCSYVSLLSSSSTDQNETAPWSIPFTYILEDSSSHRILEQQQQQPIWIDNRSITLIEPNLTSFQWLLANPGFQYPYRVNYDLENWSKLIRQLRRRPDRIPTKSRLQLILDAAFFLKETDVGVEYFLDLLGYLRKETHLLPLIFGIREIYSLLDQYKASSVYPLLVFYFRPVVEQASKIRSISERDAESDAVWWSDDSFSLMLKLLQCATRNAQCRISREDVHGVLSIPNSGPITDKLIPICEYLKRNFSDTERRIVAYWLDQERSHRISGGDSGASRKNEAADGLNNFWRQDVLYMAACVRDEVLIERLIDAALARGDLEFLATSLSSTFTLNYNDLFVTELWKRLGDVGIGAGAPAANPAPVERHARNMMRSVRTLSELQLARKALSALHIEYANDDFRYMEARLMWQERRRLGLEDWLMQKLEADFF